MNYTVRIPIRPKSKSRPRFDPRNIRTYTEKSTREFEDFAFYYCKKTIKKVITGPMIISVVFVFKTPRKKPVLNFPLVPDLDNILKSLLDGMNKGIISDDGYICGFKSIYKIYGEKDEIILKIEQVENITEREIIETWGHS